MFTVFFEILAGFILGILAEIPGAFFSVLPPNSSERIGRDKNKKEFPMWVHILFGTAIIIGSLYFGALLFRWLN